MEYKKDDVIILDIEDMGVDGEGIGKLGGFAFFVKDAVIGDKVEAKVMKVKKSQAYARLMKLLVPSPNRAEPKCQYHKQCGGCQIQALDYQTQLLFKTNKVKNNLMRIGGFSEELLDMVMEPIVGMQNPYRYRNKAQFPIGTDKNGEIITGFYAGRTHVIIPNTDCVLGVRENKIILEILLDYMKKYKIEPYNETTGKGLIRHILIRKGFTSGEIMVCVIINGDKLPQEEKLVEALAKVEGMTSISINTNKEKTNVIMGAKCRTIWGNDKITDVIYARSMADINAGIDGIADGTAKDSGITFAISPLSFYQVNPIQTEKLYSIALEYARLTGEETVWDLYCGIGTISLFMAKKAKQVYGIEIIEQAIQDARENARRNNITNVQFYTGKAEEVLPRLYEDEGIYADVICVDPPRKGCDEACLNTMLKMAPKRIVYVSCDSATLARDLKYLCGNGYRLEKVRAVDQFPGTVHVETVVMLSHKKPDSVINVKVEFGEGEGKVPLDNIAKRAEAYKPKERVTYKMIKEYIEAKYGFKVHTAYIAEVKRDLGLPMYDAPNAVEELKHPRKHPTPEKVEAIKDALKHFEVI